MKNDEEKLIGVFRVPIKKENVTKDEVSLIRKVHRNMPRKLVVSEIVDTSIDGENATCTVKLKRAQMVSLDEIKAYIDATGERTTMKRFLNWLNSLK